MKPYYNYKVIYWEMGHFSILEITSEEKQINDVLIEEIRSGVLKTADIVGIIWETAQNFEWEKFYDLIK